MTQWIKYTYPIQSRELCYYTLPVTKTINPTDKFTIKHSLRMEIFIPKKQMLKLQKI